MPSPPRSKTAAPRSRATAHGKAWAGRFREPTDPAVEAFSTSIATDLAMARHDIRGSVAHVHGLRRAGLLAAREADRKSTRLNSSHVNPSRMPSSA